MSAEDLKVKQWEFFCKELHKGIKILGAMDLIASNININGGKYMSAFVVILDSLTTKIYLLIGQIFDNQNDSLRFTSIIDDKKGIQRLSEIKSELELFIRVRHTRFGHISKKAEEVNDYNSNFVFLDKANVSRLRVTFEEMFTMLVDWGVKNNNGNVIGGWDNEIDDSFQMMLSDLERMRHEPNNSVK